MPSLSDGMSWSQGSRRLTHAFGHAAGSHRSSKAPGYSRSLGDVVPLARLLLGSFHLIHQPAQPCYDRHILAMLGWHAVLAANLRELDADLCQPQPARIRVSPRLRAYFRRSLNRRGAGR